MLQIPFLGAYISKIVQEEPVSDAVDWLNYYWTSLLLSFFALMISAKQYFGSPIQCWVPMEFKYGWEQFTEDYCFIANSYYVPFEKEVPEDFSQRADHISYYRWVPIVLALQAFFFYFPNWIWSMLHKKTAVNPQAIVSEVRKCRNLCGEQREKEVENVAHYITDAIAVFDPSRSKTAARSGYNATLIYLFIKFLYLVNVVGQLIVLNRFLGGEYFTWGIDTMRDVLTGHEWKESEIFPRVILCDFQVRRLGNIQRYTVQCVIMMNLINEKLYFFLYFWLIFVGLVTLVNFFYTLAILGLPILRTSFIKGHINKREAENFPELNFPRFVHDYLRPDGVLLVHFVRQHLGGRITYDLMNEILRLYWLKSHKEYLNGSPESEKCLPRGPNYNDNIRRSAIAQAPPTYKPTSYGPSSLYPGNLKMTHPSTPAPPGFSSPTGTQRTSPDEAIDFIDDGTLRIGELNKELRPITPNRGDNVGSATRRTPATGNRQNAYAATPKTTSSV